MRAASRLWRWRRNEDFKNTGNKPLGRNLTNDVMKKRTKRYVEPEAEESSETELLQQAAKTVEEGEKADLDDSEDEDAATPAEETRQPYDGNTAFHLYLREV